jgi:hypothetical protein
MKKDRFYKIAVVVLVLINIACLSFLWFNRPPHPPKPGAHEISSMLGLTGDNKSKVDKIEKDHHREKRKLVDRDIKLHNELYGIIGTDENADSLLNVIDQNKKEIEKMTFDYFDEVASYCNDEQKAELRRFVHHAFEQLIPGKGPRP